MVWQQSFFSGEEYYRGKRGDDFQEIEKSVDELPANELFGHIKAGEFHPLQGQVHSYAYVGMFLSVE